MNPEELWETTLNPENNTLLKVDYSGNDVDNETTNPGDRDREIFKILMGEDVVPRKDLGIAMEEAKNNGSDLPITKIIDGYYSEVQKTRATKPETTGS